MQGQDAPAALRREARLELLLAHRPRHVRDVELHGEGEQVVATAGAQARRELRGEVIRHMRREQVQEARVDHRAEPAPEQRGSQRVGDVKRQPLGDLGWQRLGLRPGLGDGLIHAIDPHHLQATPGQRDRVVAGAAANVEHRAGGWELVPQRRKGRLWPADVPRRGLLVDRVEECLRVWAEPAHGTLTVVDLPGTYSLAARSLEEQIARDFIVRERPDAVVNVIDAANLERNLYLTAQLIETGVRLILVLNMVDVAAARGLTLNPQALAAELGVPVLTMAASRGEGLAALKVVLSDLRPGVQR